MLHDAHLNYVLMFLLSYFTNHYFVFYDSERHGDVIGEELASSEALRHRDVRPIDIGGKLGDGVQSDVTLKGRGDPGADALLLSGLYPLPTSLHATMKRGLEDDVTGLDDIQHVTFHLRVVHTDKFFIEGDGQG